ncbi:MULTISPECIES: hypothetical protein [unclassified Paraburkholderia]|uniref:hypothetical protein n=1 Tax=unclassified Paraburkholderia TaxID=2615204 RepID=UPI0016099ACF|nr:MULTISPECIES: hypothetical protein [unclassified Paraburkholderia]MBB5446721.1 hypothetical protein [Paraburkholderia sp. WSM4177]MBB5487266.1 hypothetical protein [Paraburkholderia sp. WSM4180]
MTPERFHQIVAAYGADARRWPEREREAAQAWAREHRAEADAALSDAASLDAWLAADELEPPSLELQRRIIDRAPSRRPAARWRLWWSGAAVAGVGLLGGVAGAFTVSFFVLTGNAPVVHESSYLTSSFGGSSADWSGE